MQSAQTDYGQMRTDITRASVGAITPVTIGAASAQSAAMPAGTRAVRLVATVDCFVEFGTNPTATSSGAATGFFMPAGSVEYFVALEGHKVAVIQGSGAGTLYLRATN
jgi:hypothetical protein